MADAEENGKRFRGALGVFPTGITIVTSRTPEGRDFDLTATSFNSVSLDPPLVLWSLDRKSSNAAAFERVDAFGIHVLAAGQEPVCRQFFTRGIDRFAEIEVVRGHGGVPIIAGCAAVFECRMVHRYEGGDHVIMVGEVVSFSRTASDPLVFYRGRVAPLCPPETAAGRTPPARLAEPTHA